GDVAHADELAAVEFNFGAFNVADGFSAQVQARHRSDTGQRFAAKAERRDGFEVFGAAQLRRSVALEGNDGIVAHHPFAVINDADQSLAARFDLHVEAARA